MKPGYLSGSAAEPSRKHLLNLEYPLQTLRPLGQARTLVDTVSLSFRIIHVVIEVIGQQSSISDSNPSGPPNINQYLFTPDPREKCEPHVSET